MAEIFYTRFQLLIVRFITVIFISFLPVSSCIPSLEANISLPVQCLNISLPVQGTLDECKMYLTNDYLSINSEANVKYSRLNIIRMRSFLKKAARIRNANYDNRDKNLPNSSNGRRNDDKIYIIVLGGSMTAGRTVNGYERAWPNRLQDDLNNHIRHINHTKR
jgi:hypothetical protein